MWTEVKWHQFVLLPISVWCCAAAGDLKHKQGLGEMELFGSGPLGEESNGTAVYGSKRMWIREHRSGSDGEKTNYHLLRCSSLTSLGIPWNWGREREGSTKEEKGANGRTHTFSGTLSWILFHSDHHLEGPGVQLPFYAEEPQVQRILMTCVDLAGLSWFWDHVQAFLPWKPRLI